MNKRDFILKHAQVDWMFHLPREVQGFKTSVPATPEQEDRFQAASYDDEIDLTEVTYHITYKDGTTEDITKDLSGDPTMNDTVKNMSVSCRLLYLYLKIHGSLERTFTRLADETGCSPDTISRSLAKLHAEGVIDMSYTGYNAAWKLKIVE